MAQRLQPEFLQHRRKVAAEARGCRGGQWLDAVETHRLSDDGSLAEHGMPKLADEAAHGGMFVVGGLCDVPDRRGRQTLIGKCRDGLLGGQAA